NETLADLLPRKRVLRREASARGKQIRRGRRRSRRAPLSRPHRESVWHRSGQEAPAVLLRGRSTPVAPTTAEFSVGMVRRPPPSIVRPRCLCLLAISFTRDASRRSCPTIGLEG